MGGSSLKFLRFVRLGSGGTLLEGNTSDAFDLLVSEEDSHLELSNDFTFTFVEGSIAEQVAVLVEIGHGEADLLVVDAADGEGEDTEAGVDFLRNFLGGLELGGAVGFKSLLVDTRLGVTLTELALTSGEDDIHGPDGHGFDVVGVDLVLGERAAGNGVEVVNDEAADLVGENTFDVGETEVSGGLLDDVSDLVGLHTGAEVADGGVEDLVGGGDELSFLGFRVEFTVDGDLDGVGDLGAVSVDVDTKVDLDDVVEGELLVSTVFTGNAGFVGSAVVDAEGSGETNTLLDTLEHLGDELADEFITGLADVDDDGVGLAELDDFLESFVGPSGGLLVLVGDFRVVEGGVFFFFFFFSFLVHIFPFFFGDGGFSDLLLGHYDFFC